MSKSVLRLAVWLSLMVAAMPAAAAPAPGVGAARPVAPVPCFPAGTGHAVACAENTACCTDPLPAGLCTTLAQTATSELTAAGYQACGPIPKDQIPEPPDTDMLRRLLVTLPGGWTTSQLDAVRSAVQSHPQSLSMLGYSTFAPGANSFSLPAFHFTACGKGTTYSFTFDGEIGAVDRFSITNGSDVHSLSGPVSGPFTIGPMSLEKRNVVVTYDRQGTAPVSGFELAAISENCPEGVVRQINGWTVVARSAGGTPAGDSGLGAAIRKALKDEATQAGNPIPEMYVELDGPVRPQLVGGTSADPWVFWLFAHRTGVANIDPSNPYQPPGAELENPLAGRAGGTGSSNHRLLEIDGAIDHEAEDATGDFPRPELYFHGEFPELFVSNSNSAGGGACPFGYCTDGAPYPDPSVAGSHASRVGSLVWASYNNDAWSGLSPDVTRMQLDVNIEITELAGGVGGGLGDITELLEGVISTLVAQLSVIKPEHVDAITMSLGVPFANQALLMAFTPFWDAGVPGFFAAGNDGGSQALYPGAYNTHNLGAVPISSVGNFDPVSQLFSDIDQLSPFYIGGPPFLPFGSANQGGDLVAVGVGPFPRLRTDGAIDYHRAIWAGGTSLSTPAAAATYMALLGITTDGEVANFPKLNALDKRQRMQLILGAMKAAATDLGPAGFDEETGYGQVNGEQALAYLEVYEAETWFTDPLERISGMTNNAPSHASGIFDEVQNRMSFDPSSYFELNYGGSEGSCLRFDIPAKVKWGDPELTLPVDNYFQSETLVPASQVPSTPPGIQDDVQRTQHDYEITADIEVDIDIYLIPILSCFGIGVLHYTLEGEYRPVPGDDGVTRLTTWHQINVADEYKVVDFEEIVPEMKTDWDVDGLGGGYVLDAAWDMMGPQLEQVHPTLDDLIAPTLRQESRKVLTDVFTAHRNFDPLSPTRYYHRRTGTTFGGYQPDQVLVFDPLAVYRHAGDLPLPFAPHTAISEVSHVVPQWSNTGLPAWLTASFDRTPQPAAETFSDHDWQSDTTQLVREWQLNTRAAQGLFHSPRERLTATTTYSTDAVLELRDLDTLPERGVLTLFDTPDANGNWGTLVTRHRADFASCSVRVSPTEEPDPVPERIGDEALQGQPEPCPKPLPRRTKTTVPAPGGAFGGLTVGTPLFQKNPFIEWGEIEWTQTTYLSAKEVHRADGGPETLDARVAFERRVHPYTKQVDIEFTALPTKAPFCGGCPWPRDPVALNAIGFEQEDLEVAIRELYSRKVVHRILQTLGDEYWTPYFNSGVNRMTIAPLLNVIETFAPGLVLNVNPIGWNLRIDDQNTAESVPAYELFGGGSTEADTIRTLLDYTPGDGGGLPDPPDSVVGVFHGYYKVDLDPFGQQDVVRQFSYAVIGYPEGDFDHTESRNYNYVTKYEGPSGPGEEQPLAVFYISDLFAYRNRGTPVTMPHYPDGVIPEFDPSIHKAVFVPRRDMISGYATRACSGNPGSPAEGEAPKTFSCIVGRDQDQGVPDHVYHVVPWARNRLTLARPKECLHENQIRLSYYRHNGLNKGPDGVYYTWDFGEVNPSAMDLELVENYQFTPATSDFDVALPTVCEDEPGTTNGGYGHWGGGGGDPPDWEIYPNIPPWDGPPLVH